MTAISRRALIASRERFKRERDQLLEICAKQRIFIQEQHRAYAELFGELQALRGDIRSVRELGLRYGLLCKAVDAEREEGAPLQ